MAPSAHAAACDSASAEERRQYVDTVAGHLQELELWTRHCPANFENRAALVAAELARVDGRDGDATRLYEHAIRAARQNGFVHHEALALELAARFYAAGGFDGSRRPTCETRGPATDSGVPREKCGNSRRSIRIWQTNRLARTRNARWPRRDTYSRCSSLPRAR